MNYLGALDDEGELTDLGMKMSEVPLEPPLAKILLVSPDFSCSNEAASLVALLSAPNIFMRPRESAAEADECKALFTSPDGDHLSLLTAYEAYLSSGRSRDWCYEHYLNYRSLQSADSIREQLVRILKKLNLPLVSTPQQSGAYISNLKACLVSGLFMHVAHLQRQGHYLTVKDQQVVAIHPSSVVGGKGTVKPVWVLFQEFVLTSKVCVCVCSLLYAPYTITLHTLYTVYTSFTHVSHTPFISCHTHKHTHTHAHTIAYTYTHTHTHTHVIHRTSCAL